jgi:hypothetical protein
VGVLQVPGKVHIMNKPDGGEFSGQTAFLTMPDIWQNGEEILRRISFQVFEEFTALLAMSDGISDVFLGTDNKFFDGEEWQQLWNKLTEELTIDRKNEDLAGQMVDWLNFWAESEHDDRTLALLIPNE